MRAQDAQGSGDLVLPTLPVEAPEFWADPERFLAPARRRHPWLARFSQGYVVHGCQANKDLFQDDEQIGRAHV